MLCDLDLDPMTLTRWPSYSTLT